MKKIITIICGILLLSCSEDNEVNNESSSVLIQPVSVEFTIKSQTGEKLLTDGTLNRNEIIIKEEKNDGSYEVNNELLSLFCENDLSGIYLESTKATNANSYTKKYKIELPNQQEYNIEMDVQKTPNQYTLHWYLKTVRVNSQVIFEGDENQPGEYCHSTLKLDLIINE